MFETKMYRGVMCHNKNDGKFGNELTCTLKSNISNLANFDPTLKSLNTCTLTSSF